MKFFLLLTFCGFARAQQTYDAADTRFFRWQGRKQVVGAAVRFSYEGAQVSFSCAQATSASLVATSNFPGGSLLRVYVGDASGPAAANVTLVKGDSQNYTLAQFPSSPATLLTLVYATDPM